MRCTVRPPPGTSPAWTPGIFRKQFPEVSHDQRQERMANQMEMVARDGWREKTKGWRVMGGGER
jgi:hypothetical protein